MKVRYLSEEGYDNLHGTFIDRQKSKPRYETYGYINQEGEYEEKKIEKKMTDNWNDLQKEYNQRDKERIKEGELYFIM